MENVRAFLISEALSVTTCDGFFIVFFRPVVCLCCFLYSVLVIVVVKT